MKFGKILAAACLTVATACGTAMAIPSEQIAIPSTDAKGFKEVTLNIISTQRFSSKGNAGASSYDAGVLVGVLPFESLKLEVGFDYLTSNLQSDNSADNHPFYLNAKLATPEDLGFKGMPAFAVGAYNLGIYDKPERGIQNSGDVLSTRQNLAYALVARTCPVIGRLSIGGYYGAERALATTGTGNPSITKNNSGILASWDRSMTEISDKLWFGVDYLSGNNANGELGIGGSWAFSKQ
ncbi:MAG: hypothetical protein P4L44_09765, partial [Oryzomonas sp.]|uniref:hypothetical protein n=1 Tax=Oryzomonas sp. TaxID=2855186 RepID=UPI0028454602